MRRRLFTFALLLGLLGAVHSSLACAANALAEDCHGGMEMPCDHESGGGGGAPSDPQLCCPTTPTSAIAAVALKKAEYESLQRASDLVAAVPQFTAIDTVARAFPRARSSPGPDVASGTGLYLQTLRLRL